MNFVDRSFIRSIASNQVKLEKENGKSYSPEAIIDIWNTDYGLVSEENLSALKEQYALEIAAERSASEKSISISSLGVTEIKFDSLRGKLKLGPKDPGGAPAGGGAIEA